MSAQERQRRYYLSHRENIAAYHHARVPERRRQPIEMICPVCSKPFMQKRKDKKTCTPNCRQILRYRRLHPEPVRACQICGGPIQFVMRGRHRTVCSDVCSQERARRRTSAWYHDAVRQRERETRSAINREAERVRRQAYREAHREERRARWRLKYWRYRQTFLTYSRAKIRLGGGERIHPNRLPPEWKEIALLLKNWRQSIREQRRGIRS